MILELENNHWPLQILVYDSVKALFKCHPQWTCAEKACPVLIHWGLYREIDSAAEHRQCMGSLELKILKKGSVTRTHSTLNWVYCFPSFREIASSCLICCLLLLEERQRCGAIRPCSAELQVLSGSWPMLGSPGSSGSSRPAAHGHCSLRGCKTGWNSVTCQCKNVSVQLLDPLTKRCERL